MSEILSIKEKKGETDMNIKKIHKIALNKTLIKSSIVKYNKDQLNKLIIDRANKGKFFINILSTRFDKKLIEYYLNLNYKITVYRTKFLPINLFLRILKIKYIRISW